MVQKICYRIDALLKLLPGFNLEKIKLILSDEDFMDSKQAFFITNRSDISFVEKYYSLWTSQTVSFNDGTKLNFKSNNVNSHDESILRINKNHIISPVLIVSDNYVQATEELKEWLCYNNIFSEKLDEITDTFNVATEIEYLGVPTPTKTSYGSWAYSSETLKLNDMEIEEALNGIEDELLRKKIECILYARVFKRRY